VVPQVEYDGLDLELVVPAIPEGGIGQEDFEGGFGNGIGYRGI